MGNVAHGRHPLHRLEGAGLTLGQFIDETYKPRVTANRARTATNTLETLHRHFRTCYSEPLPAITIERLESWKSRRLNRGCNTTTLLRDLCTPCSVLSRAVKLGHLKENPVQRVDKPVLTAGPECAFWTMGAPRHVRSCT